MYTSFLWLKTWHITIPPLGVVGLSRSTVIAYCYRKVPSSILGAETNRLHQRNIFLLFFALARTDRLANGRRSAHSIYHRSPMQRCASLFLGSRVFPSSFRRCTPVLKIIRERPQESSCRSFSSFNSHRNKFGQRHEQRIVIYAVAISVLNLETPATSPFHLEAPNPKANRHPHPRYHHPHPHRLHTSHHSYTCTLPLHLFSA